MAKAPSGSARGARPTQQNSTPASTRRRPQNQPMPASGLARFRKEHPMLGALVPVAVVVLALVTLVVIKAPGGSGAAPPASKVAAGTGSAASGAGTSALPAGVLADVTSVSSATLAAIGEPNGTVSPSA